MSAYRDAQRNLGYTKVKAPVDGRVGIIDVTVGNFVNSISGPLTTINSSNPMYVTFPLDSKDFVELTRVDGAANVARDVEYIFNSGLKYDLKSLRQELSARLKELITFIPDDEKYAEKWSLLKMVAIRDEHRGYGCRGRKLYDSMLKNRGIAADIEAKLQAQPEKMDEILGEVKEFERMRKAAGISIYSFRKKKNPVLNTIGKGLAALVGLPYFIFSIIASLPMWVASEVIRGKVRDAAFRNTVSFGVKLAMSIILTPIYAALAFCLAPWWLALALMLLWYPSYGYFYDYIEGCRRWVADIKLLGNKKLWKKFKGIVKQYQNL